MILFEADQKNSPGIEEIINKSPYSIDNDNASSDEIPKKDKLKTIIPSLTPHPAIDIGIAEAINIREITKTKSLKYISIFNDCDKNTKIKKVSK